MAYVYVCDSCLDDEVHNCEQVRDIPTDPNVYGGGHCVCRCDEPDNKFIASIRASMLDIRERKKLQS